MPVETTDLGADVCRAIMRDMDDKPIALELRTPGWPPAYEATGAGERAILWQWCAVLMPTLDFVTVRAQLRRWDAVLYDLAPLHEGSRFPEYLFVRYPADPAAITGPEYEARLRAAVEKAVAVVEADRARVYAEHAAVKSGALDVEVPGGDRR